MCKKSIFFNFYHSHIHKNLFRIKLILTYIILISGFFLLINYILNFSIQNIMLETAVKETDVLLENNAKVIDERFQILDDQDYIVYTRNELITSLEQLEPIERRTTFQQYEYQSNIIRTLSTFNQMNPTADSFSLYSVKGKSYFTTMGVSSLINNEAGQFLKEYHDNIGKKWIVSKTNADAEPVLLNYHPIFNFETNELIGFLSMNINVSTIEKQLDSIQIKNTGYLFAQDGNGVLVSTGDKEEVRPFLNVSREKDAQQNGIITVQGEDYLMADYVSPYTGWNYYAVVPVAEIVSEASSIRDILTIFYFAVIAVFISAFVIDSRFFYQPFIRLFKAMKQVEDGDLSAQIVDSRKDEIGYIYSAFNNMTISLNQQIQENYVNRLLLQEAQLMNVYSKLDEHFLYNTLDSVRWATKRVSPDEISDILLHLSRFYRISLSGGKDMIRVSEEANLLESYLSLQRFRLQNVFEYKINIDPRVRDFYILKYLLQPLVENSVVHGIKGRKKKGVIKVEIFLRGAYIHVEVCDNGAGIREEKLQRIRMSINKKFAESGEFFALHNVNLLLKTFYGDSSYLTIESKAGKGTRIYFDLPYPQKGRENE